MVWIKGVLKDREAKCSTCAQSGQTEQPEKAISGQLGTFRFGLGT